MSKKEHAVEEQRSLTTVQSTVPAVIDFAADAGCGFEEADASSYAIPFLRQLQAMSPQCKKTDPGYVKGAEEGDFVNTVTERVYKGEDGVLVVPCYYLHKYNEWAADRGGFRGSHTADQYAMLKRETRQENGKTGEYNVDTGNQLVDAREHYVLVVEADGTFSPALLVMTGSQLKKSKKWMTLMQNIRIGANIAPMFSQMYHIQSVSESNDKGSWAGMKIDHLKQVTNADVYNAAKNFRDMVRKGAAKAVTPTEADDVSF